MAPTYDPNEKRDVEKRAQREKLAERTAADDVRAVMDIEPGRRFVNGLLGLCDLRGDGYVRGGKAAQREQDYLAGRRSVGIDLLGQIEIHAMEQTQLMTAEARKAEAEERAMQEAEQIDSVEETQETTDG